MNILTLGGTRFLGKHMVRSLIKDGHRLTIATRGRAKDDFGSHVNHLVIERTDPNSLKEVLSGKHYDVICDSLAYCSNDVKYLLDIADCNKYIMISSTAVYEKHLNIQKVFSTI